ncbi:hypothetical protein SDC9_166553 [bioreactor metagenome]|uniref:Uncharacterized protein n=1 Tax=bioreactor metagenome TaxID=1076179 RepID=A0A645FXD5_9ZZZZ
MVNTTYKRIRGNRFDLNDERLIQQAYGSDLHQIKRADSELGLYTDISPELRPFFPSIEMHVVEEPESSIEEKLTK